MTLLREVVNGMMRWVYKIIPLQRKKRPPQPGVWSLIAPISGCDLLSVDNFCPLSPGPLCFFRDKSHTWLFMILCTSKKHRESDPRVSFAKRRRRRRSDPSGLDDLWEASENWAQMWIFWISNTCWRKYCLSSQTPEGNVYSHPQTTETSLFIRWFLL